MAAGAHLLTYYDIIQHGHRKLAIKDYLNLFTHCISHIRLYKAAGGMPIPKHHMWMHLTQDAMQTGNPSFTSTYEDESENGMIAHIALACHRSRFEISLFERLDVLDRLQMDVVDGL